MGMINIIIIDESRNRKQSVELPDDTPCDLLMKKLIEKINFPLTGADGNPINYKFINTITGQHVIETQTLSEAGIKNGDILLLQPKISSGKICSNCGSIEPKGSKFCGKCGKPITHNQQRTHIPGQIYPPYPVYPHSNTDKSGISKVILILGIIAVSIYMLANLMLYTLYMLYRDVGTFFNILKYAGDALFMLDVVIYMVNKIKK